jgi:hypothetical protein
MNQFYEIRQIKRFNFNFRGHLSAGLPIRNILKVSVGTKGGPSVGRNPAFGLVWNMVRDLFQGLDCCAPYPLAGIL